MRWAPLAALLLLLLAGCSGKPATQAGLHGDPTAPAAAWSFGTPVQALDACKYANCYEPTIAADPQGRLFVADGVTSKVAVSADGGKTWTPRDPPAMPMGLTGDQSDVIVQVAPTGRLYWSALVVAYPPTGGGAVLFGIQVAWSDDGAATWAGTSFTSPVQGAPVLYPDRQWLGFAPDGTMYVTYNQIPSAIWIARSADKGQTWSGWRPAASSPERGGGIGQSGPPVVDSKGRVYVPACAIATGAADANGGTQVYYSDDQAATFAKTLVSGGCSWFPILAVARDDTLVLANQPGSVTLSVSRDGGKSFDALGKWGKPTADAAAWPVPGPGDELRVAWFDAGASTADLHVARGTLSHGLADDAKVGTAQGTGSTRTTARTDYASAALLPDGRLATVFVDGKTAKVAVELPET